MGVMRVLVVEDSIELRKPLVAGLTRCGYHVDSAVDGNIALWMAQGKPFDLIVLDIMLPGLDGISVLRKLREAGNRTRVLLLTARDTTSDKVSGLRAGADDYLTKPFAFDELLARIEALLRRQVQTSDSVLTLGALKVNLAEKQAYLLQQPVTLTPREYAILEYLIRNRGRVVSRTQIEQEVYDEQVEPMSNVVDSAICSLRRKIDPQGAPSLIQTRRGLGYMILKDVLP